MCEVKCPYLGKCKSEGDKCLRCANNTGVKDYYRPDYTPYIPYPYWVPYYPYWDYYTTTSDSITDSNDTCYTTNLTDNIVINV